MVIEFINLKELFECLDLVINLKRELNVIKEWDPTWISCDNLNPITVYSYGFLGSNCTRVGQASDSLTALICRLLPGAWLWFGPP